MPLISVVAFYNIMKVLRVIVACEESQTVCKAFRALGHEAYSFDIQECSGGRPEWHYQEDIFEVLKREPKFDLMIAHPPCTYLTVTGNRWFNVEKYGDKAIQRQKDREDAIKFFIKLSEVDIEHIVVENPIGVISTVYRKPDQIIQPYMFGDAERKSICLWLKNLPLLISTNIVEPEIIQYKNGKGTDSKWHMESIGMSPSERSKFRSKTFQGIADALAKQYSEYILDNLNKQ